ncbi:YtpI family protein [Paenibacillus tyrfis]
MGHGQRVEAHPALVFSRCRLISRAEIAKVEAEPVHKDVPLKMQTIQWTLSVLIVIFLILSLYFSVRYRREAEPKQRGLYSARMNIFMGLMLVVIAVSQLFFFEDSATRRIFGTVCLLLGLFNLFAGIRNHNLFSRK